MDTESVTNCCPKCQTPLPADAPQGLCPRCLLAAVATPTEAGLSAGRPTPPALEEVAAAFPQLEILEFIGQGGMGFVFKARQPKLDRLVALKILPQSLAADPTFAERFNREARLLARLNHPGIVTVHDFGVAAGILPAVEPGFQPGGKGVESTAGWESTEAIASSDASPGGRMPPSTSGKMPDATFPAPHFYYLLMEFVDGVNLRQAMQAGRFTPDQALAIVPKICEALQFAHNEGILHRDIKPENILLDAKGRVKIADFGIAKLVGPVAQASLPAGDLGIPAQVDSDGSANWEQGCSQNPQAGKPAPQALTESGKALGTPNYMAPEQLENAGEVDHRADIYSLGVVFYEMLTGELPRGRFAPPSQKSAADPRVDEVVLRALEKEKARRQTSAEEVRTQVETIVTGSSGRESAPTESPGASESQSRLTSAATSDSRFSRTAVVGTCLIPLTALIPMMVWWVRFPIKADREKFGLLVAGVFLLIGFSAPFATTILGWMAVSQIRRSAGRIHGLWLAVFDGLLFPLLVLIGLSVVMAAKASGLLMEWWTSPVLGPFAFAYQSSPFVKRFGNFLNYHPGVPPFVGACLGAVVGVLIIRRVWRAVNPPRAATANRPRTSPGRLAWALGLLIVVAIGGAVVGQKLSGGVKITHITPQEFQRNYTWPMNPMSDAEYLGVLDSKAFMRLREMSTVNPGKWSERVVYVNLSELDPAFREKLPAIAWQPKAQGALPSGRTNSPGVPSQDSQDLTFGPVVERVLPLTELGYSCSLNLETDEMSLLPPALTMADWSSGITLPNGIIVVAPAVDRALMVAGTGTQVRPLLNGVQSWETPQKSQLEFSGAPTPGQTESVSGESSSPPATFAFRTATGMPGLLQITGFTENPRGVKIRYKRVQNDTSARAFKPIPPEAVRLWNERNEWFKAMEKRFMEAEIQGKTNNLAAFKAVDEEYNDRGKAIREMVRGTKVESLVRQQEVVAERLRVATEARDTYAAKEASEGLNLLRAQIEELFRIAAREQ